MNASCDKHSCLGLTCPIKRFILIDGLQNETRLMYRYVNSGKVLFCESLAVKIESIDWGQNCHLIMLSMRLFYRRKYLRNGNSKCDRKPTSYRARARRC